MKLAHHLGPNDCRGPSYKGHDLRELWDHALERCGEPATTKTAWGPMCASCAEDLDRAANSENTILGMLLKKRREAT